MGTEADNLVARYPTAAAQLRGPVYDYLRRYAPFPSEQSLYMAVFYPRARDWPLSKEFPPKVQLANPGIKTVGDYVRRVRAHGAVSLDPDTAAALYETSARLGVPVVWLRSLIDFESRFDPLARNPVTGARGLLQWLPSTARSMGFVVAGSVAVAVVIGLLIWYLVSK